MELGSAVVNPMSKTPIGSRSVIAWGWVAVVIASELPRIIWYLVTDSKNQSISLQTIQIALLLSLSALVTLNRKLLILRHFMYAIVAYTVGRDLILLLEQHPFWQSPWLGPLLNVIPVGLMTLTLLGRNFDRMSFFLDWGSPMAKGTWFGRPLSWAVSGPLLIVLFAAGLTIHLIRTLHPHLSSFSFLLVYSPLIVLIALWNTLSEEYQFRSVLLGRLYQVFGRGQSLLLSSTLFGISHWFGNPSGFIGVIMAFCAGWVWGKSVLDTKGSNWNLIIHFVQDVFIFGMLVMTN